MRHRRKRRTARKRLGVLLLAAVILLVILFVDLDTRLRPIVQNYAVQAARRSAVMAVHDGMERTLTEHPTCYDELIRVTRSDSGEVLSAQANVAAINLLKAKASQAVVQSLADRQEQKVTVPLGNLIGGSFFTGRGPFLPLTVHVVGSVVTSLRDSFTDAGINQTCHAIYLTVTVIATVQLPLERQSFQVETEFLVSETVLIGTVPDSYTHMHLEETGAVSEIFDLNN